MKNRLIKTKITSLIVALSLIITCLLPVMNVAAVTDAYSIIPATTFDREASYNPDNRQWEILSDRVGTFWAPGYMVFRDIDFGSEGATSFTATAGARAGYASAVQLRLDDPKSEVIATVPFEQVSFQDPRSGSVDLAKPITGVHTVYISPDKSTMNFYSFQFFGKEPEKFAYEMYKDGGAFANLEDSRIARDMDMLSQLGMIDAKPGEVFDGNAPVSRADFAKAVYAIYADVRAAEPEEEEETEKQLFETGFHDVAGDSEYAEAIAYLAQNGIMNGIGGGNFAPEYFISQIDAITVLVRAFEYKQEAEEAGGYPNGYIKTAAKYKLLKGSINNEDVLRQDGLVSLLTNALHAKYLTPEAFVDGYVKYETIDCILNETQNVYRGEGKVTATAISTLVLPDSGLGQKEVIIGGTKYLIGRTNAAALLGYECEFYYEEVNDQKILRAIVPMSGVEVTSISSAEDEISNITDSKIIYTPSGEDREEVIEFADGAAIIYNGVAADKKLTDLVDNEKNFTGFINIVDNEDGSQTVIVDEYMDVIVESIDLDKTGIVAAKTTDVLKKVKVDWEDDSFTVIENILGETIKTKDIKVNNLFTVYASKNETGKKLIRMYLSESEVTGMVTEIRDGEIYINGVKYAVSNSAEAPTIGQEAIFRLNIYGDIVFAKVSDSTSWKMGVFLGVTSQETGFGKEIKIKLLNAEGKLEIYKVGSSLTIDADKKTEEDKILSALKSILYPEVSNDVALILYRTREDGSLAAIDTAYDPSKDGANADKKDGNVLRLIQKDSDGLFDGDDKPGVYKYDRTAQVLMSGDNKEVKYYMPKSAKVFAFYGAEDRENNCLVGTASGILSTGNPWGSLYSTTGSEYECDVFIWHTHNMVGYAGETLFVYESSAQGINAEGDEITVVKGWANGMSVEYKLDLTGEIPTNSNAQDLAKAKKGDIFIVRSYDDKTVYGARIQMLYDASSTKREGMEQSPLISTSNDSNNLHVSKGRLAYGKIISREDEYIVLERSGGKTEIVPLSGSVCIVESVDGNYYLDSANLNSIEVGDMMFVYIKESKVNSIVIYK